MLVEIESFVHWLRRRNCINRLLRHPPYSRTSCPITSWSGYQPNVCLSFAQILPPFRHGLLTNEGEIVLE
jgi:hypothetical protein